MDAKRNTMFGKTQSTQSAQPAIAHQALASRVADCNAGQSIWCHHLRPRML